MADPTGGNRNYENVDWENLLAEIEDMGKRERQAIRSNLVIVLLHLLKWQFQPEHRTGSWARSITEYRGLIIDSLEDSPSLKSHVADGLEKCYQRARKQAHQETGLALNLFPPECPYAVEEILDDDFLPEN